MDWKLELVQVPVSDVDRAKAFYEQAGFIAEHDAQASEEIRFVQLTPPGSACSIALTTGVHQMQPGCLDGLMMVVPDAEIAYQELRSRGIEAQGSRNCLGAGSCSSKTPTATAGPCSSYRIGPQSSSCATEAPRLHTCDCA